MLGRLACPDTVCPAPSRRMPVSTKPVEDDVDVASERQRVLRGDADNDMVKIENLTKVGLGQVGQGQTGWGCRQGGGVAQGCGAWLGLWVEPVGAWLGCGGGRGGVAWAVGVEPHVGAWLRARCTSAGCAAPLTGKPLPPARCISRGRSAASWLWTACAWACVLASASASLVSTARARPAPSRC